MWCSGTRAHTPHLRALLIGLRSGDSSAYLVGVPLLTTLFTEGALVHVPAWCSSVPPAFLGHRGLLEQCWNPPGALHGWSLPEFITLTKLELCMFIPYNTVAFKFISPQVRPLTHAMISATFNVAVSAVTLGFFDVWCERAAHML